MDLTLSLSYQEQNDNKALVLTDTSNWNEEGDHLIEAQDLVVGTMYEIVSRTTFDFTSTSGSTSNNVGSRFVALDTGTLGASDEVMEVTPKVTEITSATLDTTITDTSYEATDKSQVNLVTEFGNGSPPEFDTTADLVCLHKFHL